MDNITGGIGVNLCKKFKLLSQFLPNF